MNKDLNNKKAEFLKSIMKNPKLSRVFSDALSSPIGSTKRTQSKAILSIMKKLGGIKNDGQGGPGVSYGQQPTFSSKQPKDYSNMIIFPAAPKFKVKKESKQYDGKGGPGDTPTSLPYEHGLFYKAFAKGIPATVKAAIPLVEGTAGLGQYVGQNVLAGLSTGGTFLKKAAVGYDPNKPQDGIPFTPLSKTWGIKKAADYPLFKPSVTYPSLSASNVSTQPFVSQKTSTTSAATPTTTGVTGGEVAPSAPGAGVSGATTQSVGAPAPSSTPSPTGETKPSDIYDQAQQAVDKGIGPASFALGVVNEKFGGGLEKYLDDLDTRLKKDFKLDAIEQSLTDISSLKSNFVPTMENYIRGKDQYLKFVDNLIDQTNNSLMKMDTSNPAVKNQVDTYLTYLYTLKGRQNQRYGSLLNNAIADYNADAERIKNQYDTVYKRYNETITRKATIAQNEYNTLYTTMTDLYNNLQDAPIRQKQSELLDLQLVAGNLANIQNATKSSSINYLPEQKEYKDLFLDKDGGLMTSAIINLPSQYTQLINAGKTPKGITDIVQRGIATGLFNAKKEEGVESAINLANDYRNMINNLAEQPGGGQYATQLAPTFARASGSLMNDYVFSNLPKFKEAINSLVSGGWTGKSYLASNDKTGWVKENKSLINDKVLNDIYDAIKINQNQVPDWSKNPVKIFTTAKDANGNAVDLGSISNIPDDVFKDKIVTMLTSMWAEEPSQIISKNQ